MAWVYTLPAVTVPGTPGAPSLEIGAEDIGPAGAYGGRDSPGADSDLVFLAPRRSLRAAIRWRARLEGTFWRFDLRWRDRSRSWALGITTSAGETLQDGIRVGVGVNLIVGSDPRLPPGQIFAVDTDRLHRSPPRDAWTTTWELRYREAAAVEAFEASGASAAAVGGGGLPGPTPEI